MSSKWVEVVEKIEGDSFPLHLLSCESWIFVKESQIEKKAKTKKANSALQYVRILVYVDEERLESFMTEVPIITETSLLICRTNQWTGFFTTRTSVMK